MTARGGLGLLTQGKLAARVLSLKHKGKEDRNKTVGGSTLKAGHRGSVVSSPKPGGASRTALARTTVASHRGSVSSQAAASSPGPYPWPLACLASALAT